MDNINIKLKTTIMKTIQVLAILFFTCFLLAVPCPAAGETAVDDILSEFEDEGETGESTEQEIQTKPSMFSLNGHVKFSSAYNFAHEKPEPGQTDWRGFSKMKSEIQLELEAKFSPSWQAKLSGRGTYDIIYKQHGKDEYTTEILNEYQREGELWESYLQGSITKNLDLKIGRQIVVWGKSDNIRITDVLNPLDNREPGMTDIEFLRLPVTMTKLDYYWGNWTFTGMAIHEIRFNKNPEFGSDFYPYEFEPPHEKIPNHGGNETEFAFAVSGIFSGWDIAFYKADIFEDIPHLELVSMQSNSVYRFIPVPSFEFSTETEYEMQHADIKMTGMALNIAYGNWLFIVEAAHFDDLRFINYPKIGDITTVAGLPPAPIFTTIEYDLRDRETYSRTDLLGGIEYSGFDDTTISFEVSQKHIHDYIDRRERFEEAFSENIQNIINLFPMLTLADKNRVLAEFDAMIQQLPVEPEENEYLAVLRISRNFLNETLTLLFVGSVYEGQSQDSCVERLQIDYDVTDDLTITGGVMFYQNGERETFNDIQDNNRVFFEMKYSF